MESYIIPIFLFLLISMILSSLRDHPNAYFFRFLRLVSTVTGILFYTFWLCRDLIVPFNDNLTEVKIINKLPQPLDFYMIQVQRNTGLNTSKSAGPVYRQKHTGRIRPEHYRPEYLALDKDPEFWLAAYRGKKELVYFTQQLAQPTEKSKTIEVDNYFVQSRKLSKIANDVLEDHRKDIISHVVWITLSILLIFINLTLAYQKK